jgi:hypothetical protein
MMAEFEQAVGWFNDQLFDIGVPEVASAMATATQPPARYRITSTNWQFPSWVEQPMSTRAVDDPHEDFAESFAAYVQDPNALQERSPRRFTFFRDRQSRWAPELVKRRRLGDFPVPRGESRAA